MLKVTFEEGKLFADQIIKDQPVEVGIFVITDLVAIGILTYFNENKIHVSKQIKIIGFSNWFMAQVISPKLSTVDKQVMKWALNLSIYYWKK